MNTEYRQSGHELILVSTFKQKTMKLKSFNLDNSRMIQTGKPTIRLNKNAGLISLSAAACDIIGIDDQDRIEIHQDDENPEDWFIEKVKHEQGFKVRQKDSKRGKATSFNSTYLVKAIMKSVNLEDEKSVQFSISQEPVDFEGRKLFVIITANPNLASKNHS